MAKPVIVVGGGLAGLAAAIYLARGGRKVTLFEKRRNLGGRAITHLRRGFRFNLGPHAIARRGAAAKIYRELGVPVRGGSPKARGTALLNGNNYRLPVSILSLLTTSILDVHGRLEGAALLFRLRSLDTRPFVAMTAREWLDRNVKSDRLRAVMEALLRLATYSSDMGQNAASALEQLKVVVRGVVYVDEGWQKLVDALHSHAVTSGVNFVTSSRVLAIRHDGAVTGIEIGGLEETPHNDTVSVALPETTPQSLKGTFLEADTVLLAIDPMTARELVGVSEVTAPWAQLKPLTLSCLDVALSKLPDPKRTFALGIDKPLYMSVHSAYAQLTPRGGALIHVAKYGTSRLRPRNVDYDEDTMQPTPASRLDEAELEALLDQLQTGWREVLVHKRFLPAMTVSNALITPGMTRPSHATTIRGLFVAGDWVGSEGSFSDAALSSARAAAMAILAG